MWSTKRGETRFKKSVPHICLRLNCKLYLALCQMQDPIGALFIIIKMCRIKNPRPKKNFSTSLRGWGWLSWLGPTSDPSCCWAMFFVFRRYISYFEFYVALVRLAWSINIFCSIFFFCWRGAILSKESPFFNANAVREGSTLVVLVRFLLQQFIFKK